MERTSAKGLMVAGAMVGVMAFSSMPGTTKMMPGITCGDGSLCSLREGDILVKRQITPRTRLARLFGVNYTHTAMYVGEGKIAEAGGYEKNAADEVVVSDVDVSGWGEEMEQRVVVRVRRDAGDGRVAATLARRIADDGEYKFGLVPGIGFYGKNDINCVELVTRAYEGDGLFAELGDGQKVMVTPDNLVEFAYKHPEGCEILESGAELR